MRIGKLLKRGQARRTFSPLAPDQAALLRWGDDAAFSCPLTSPEESDLEAACRGGCTTFFPFSRKAAESFSRSQRPTAATVICHGTQK